MMSGGNRRIRRNLVSKAAQGCLPETSPAVMNKKVLVRMGGYRQTSVTRERSCA